MQVIAFISEPDAALVASLVESAPLIHIDCRQCAALSCIDLRILALDFDALTQAARLRSLLRCRHCGSGGVRIVQALSLSPPRALQPVQ